MEQIKIETSLTDIREAGWSLKSCCFNVPCSRDEQSFSMVLMGTLEPSLRTTDHPVPITHRREETRRGDRIPKWAGWDSPKATL